MTDQDKLSELYDFLKHDVEVSFLDGDVIDVAMDVITKLIERIKELENNIYQDARQGVIEGLYEENKRYRDALEFYANKKTYKYYKESYIDLLKDGGHTARKALETYNGDN